MDPNASLGPVKGATGSSSTGDGSQQGIVKITEDYTGNDDSIQLEHVENVEEHAVPESESVSQYEIEGQEKNPPQESEVQRPRSGSRQSVRVREAEREQSGPGGKTAGAGFALFLGGAAAVTYLGVSSGLSVAFIAGGASFGGVAIFLLIAIAAAKHAQKTDTVASKALETVGTFGVGFYAIPIIIMLKFDILEIEQKSRSEVDAGVKTSPIERRRSEIGIPAQGSKKPKDNGRSGSASEPDILKSTDRLQQGKKKSTNVLGEGVFVVDESQTQEDVDSSGKGRTGSVSSNASDPDLNLKDGI